MMTKMIVERQAIILQASHAGVAADNLSQNNNCQNAVET